MLADALVGAFLAAVLVCLGLLLLAPRLSLFDDRRRRAVALVAMVVAVSLLGVAALAAVRREIDHRETAAARRLFDALSVADPEAVLSDAANGRPLPAGATRVAELQGGGIVVYRPVRAVWTSRCIAGTIDAEGHVSVERIPAHCP
jgi:hypothetical protein